MGYGEGRWLKRSLSSQLRVAARRLGTSVASVCHVAWAQVVAQTSGRPDVVFGTVLFGRMQGGEGFDRATGVFIGVQLQVRVVLGNHSVEQSVLETHAQLARLLHHEHASLASAQRCSAVASPAPLFSALLNYRHIAPSGEAARSRSEEGIEALRSDERSNYPFSLDVNDFGGARGAAAEARRVEGGIIADVQPRSGRGPQFRGIPFAAPPVGALRWRAPQPVQPWQGERSTDQFGRNACRPRGSAISIRSTRA